MQRKLFVISVAAALLLNVVGAAAQERRGQQIIIAPPAEDEVFIAQGPGAPVPPLPPSVEIHGDNLVFMATEMTFSGKLVKGAPYSAQAVTESVQMLPDGNRIVRKNTAQVYRDTEGRTRREQTLGYIGPYSTSGDVPQTVFINDPVASVNYILDPSTKTARRLPRVELRFKTEGGTAQSTVTLERQPPPPGAAEKIAIERSYTFNVRVPGPDAPPAPGAPAPPPPAEGPQVEFFSHSSKHEAKTEKLEARAFDGVQAEGTRTTTTIPAGEVGNEQPIQIVDERWYSPELQVLVMTRHSDPRFGETTYRLTNISRAEPAATLFQVPSDYTLKDISTPGSGVRRMRRPAPPQEN
jgi:hypothetical protein